MEVMDVLMSLTTTCMPVYVSILHMHVYANKVHYTLIVHAFRAQRSNFCRGLSWKRTISCKDRIHAHACIRHKITYMIMINLLTLSSGSAVSSTAFKNLGYACKAIKAKLLVELICVIYSNCCVKHLIHHIVLHCVTLLHEF
jgi:hypothetical protein